MCYNQGNARINEGDCYMNKAKRVLDHMTGEAAAAICAKLGTLDEAATPEQQAQYINNILDTAQQMHICTADTMRKCGGCCLDPDIISLGKALYSRAADLADFLALLNREDIGGGALHLSDGKIIGIYRICYCDIPQLVAQIHPGYCECSAGWYEHFFSAVLGKQGTVTTVGTIASGAAQCTFEILVDE